MHVLAILTLAAVALGALGIRGAHQANQTAVPDADLGAFALVAIMATALAIVVIANT